MLKQTVENPDRNTVIFEGNDTSPLQLGFLLNVIYGHDISKKIEFEYLWDLPKPFHVKDAKSESEYKGDSLKFSASIGLRDLSISDLEKLEYCLFNDNDKVLSVSMKKSPGTVLYSIDAEKYELIRNTNPTLLIDYPVRFYGFSESVVANYQNADFVQALNHQHEKLFSSIYYLGPLRSKPQRSYIYPGRIPGSVGITGEDTINAMLAAKNRRLSIGKKQFEEIIADKLLCMGLIEEFKLQPIARDSHIYEVKVRTKGSNDMVDLPDVGFGVSQVLPVLVQLFYAPARSIILMEQPEIHLHPRAQALLADVMIDAIRAREDGEQRGIQLIIETHSEHFLRRLQRRIAEDVVGNEQISAYFANTSENPTRLDKLQIDLYGNIINWPEDFFGDEMGDIAAHNLAALKKRTKENG
jgi:hypothetical protein